MSFITKHKSKIIAIIFIITILLLSFLFTQNNPSAQKGKSSIVPGSKVKHTSAPEIQEVQVSAVPQTAQPQIKEEAPDQTAVSPAQEVITFRYEEGKTNPDTASVPQTAENPDTENIELFCTLSVRCDTAVGKLKKKAHILPSDGVIFPEQEVEFFEGESVFNVLLREMKKNKIHLEFVNTPVYNSAYIEGINNLYEFDMGELSGWMYSVNGIYPNYGCSQYELKNGDKIQWVYTCDLGKDVGGGYAARNGASYE